ncbi:hypothetical protein MOK15_16760 [Sphingobium sp. BYY-5]|uniref:hypothetical protein n=1 Tax=Sphingobium sp. BYY-5 TaxID=2926400 RepID=UPI001FA750D5|nr:hypothetical protein [Sphingobium sp. BYY-5]MCI4591737.1 hypothetical protein [Sphingobium sp. BYY-5]
MDAVFAIARRFFAIAAECRSSQKERAFQASSPKTFAGWSSDRSVFFMAAYQGARQRTKSWAEWQCISIANGRRKSAPVRCVIILLMARQRADQLIEAQFILHAGRKGPAKPIQTPRQKQHGPLHLLMRQL